MQPGAARLVFAPGQSRPLRPGELSFELLAQGPRLTFVTANAARLAHRTGELFTEARPIQEQGCIQFFDQAKEVFGRQLGAAQLGFHLVLNLTQGVLAIEVPQGRELGPAEAQGALADAKLVPHEHLARIELVAFGLQVSVDLRALDDRHADIPFTPILQRGSENRQAAPGHFPAAT